MAYGWSTQRGGLWLRLNTHQKAPASGTALTKQEDEVSCPRDFSQPLSGHPRAGTVSMGMQRA